jgi:hypothetical protein
VKLKPLLLKKSSPEADALEVSALSPPFSPVSCTVEGHFSVSDLLLLAEYMGT